MSHGYSNPQPPGGVKVKPPSRLRLAISRMLRSGFGLKGVTQVELDENAEHAEVFVLSGIIITVVVLGGIWFLLQYYFEAMHQ